MMAFRHFHIMLITLALAPISISNTTFAYVNNFTEQQALVSMKSLITRDPLGALSSWNHSIHFCLWKGITCSHRRQRVTALNLASQKLEGVVSPHIGNLTFLRLINFTDNNFHGYVPNEIGRLLHLRYLLLDSNSFQGGFPDNLTHCSDIREISLYNNNFGGKLPTKFASWSKLNVFILKKNHFAGSIPPSIGNISSLHKLDLSSNNLEGSIPSEVGNLWKLEFFQLSTNNLSGMIPLPLYNISSIYVFSIAGNQLTGTLPPDLGFTLPNLQYFLVGSNKLSGPFPPSIANSSNLVFFIIQYNNVSGPTPSNLGTSLHKLEYLFLDNNPLGHRGDLSFINSLVNCTSLSQLVLSENGFRGELPNSIVNLSTTLQQLFLFGNDLHGSIPDDIGKLVNLRHLELSENNLTGSIPGSIGKLSRLGVLNLNDNKISGEIPASISNITGLLMLNLCNNMLQGSIPTALFNISTLLALDLSINRLSGVIPEQVSGLSSISMGIYLHHNLFTGQLPSSIGSLKHIIVLSISDNQLTGEIPNNLGDCSMIEELSMAGNFFEGTIPSSFIALRSLWLLNLSSNNMSGNIPRFLGGFHLMQILDLSHNNFEGEVPKEGTFLNLSAFSVDANLHLCGGIQALHLPACPIKLSRTNKNRFRSRILPLVVLLPLSILACIVALLYYRIKKSKQKTIPALEQDDQYPRVTFKDLLLATSGFSRNHLLGEGICGSVYKGFLESLQQTVAVKVLNVEVHRANKSFLSECEALRNVRHRNLIKIITTCSSTDLNGNDFKALVFEFMTNGSLYNWLHPSLSDQGNERSLTLLQRLNISIDVALAVEHLHHRNHTRIIHCDLKPSNILLDEEFVAHVGDFGLARFCSSTVSDINQANTSTTGVRGTVGYVPPEYGMSGKVSTEGDVYSYGILLLEMFSGKKPTDTSVLIENANLHDYVCKAFPHGVMNIADPRITLKHKDRASIEVCLATIFEVGIMCSVETPKERIDISVAQRQLCVARDLLMSHRSKL